MNRNYYRLNLEGSIFWQREKDGTYSKRSYDKKGLEELNNIYFSKINEDVYEEKLSKNMLIVDKDKLLFPSGVSIDISKLTPCSVSEVLESFNIITRNHLNTEYYQTILDFLEYSHYYEVYSKKEEEIGKIL